jgi:hypothetical protein
MVIANCTWFEVETWEKDSTSVHISCALMLQQVNASTPDLPGQRHNLIEAAHTKGTTNVVVPTPPDELLAPAVLAGDDSSKDSCFPMAEGASATLASMRAAFAESSALARSFSALQILYLSARESVGGVAETAVATLPCAPPFCCTPASKWARSAARVSGMEASDAGRGGRP